MILPNYKMILDAEGKRLRCTSERKKDSGRDQAVKIRRKALVCILIRFLQYLPCKIRHLCSEVSHEYLNKLINTTAESVIDLILGQQGLVNYLNTVCKWDLHTDIGQCFLGDTCILSFHLILNSSMDCEGCTMMMQLNQGLSGISLF